MLNTINKLYNKSFTHGGQPISTSTSSQVPSYSCQNGSTSTSPQVLYNYPGFLLYAIITTNSSQFDNASSRQFDNADSNQFDHESYESDDLPDSLKLVA
ncbi:629_t:CDS:2, partial [Gigaspora margarita]